MKMARQITMVTLVVVWWCVIGAVLTGSASATKCSGETELVRQRESYAARLPDCRAYEQVSPTDKNGVDAVGTPVSVQAAPPGDRVTYFSLLPFPGIAGAGDFPTYLSSRIGGQWSTQGLLPPSGPAIETTVVALTKDLGKSVVILEGEGVPGEAGEVEGEEGVIKGPVSDKANSYLRDNSTGRYLLLAPGTRAKFAGSSADDSRIIFEARAKLTEKASSFSEEGFETGTNLYEWRNGRIALVGILPGGEAPAGGSVAGPGGDAIRESEKGEGSAELPGGATSAGNGTGFYTENTISQDGSRAFFTDIETGVIYMRELEADKTIMISPGRAYWRDATPDGSYVVYTEGEGKNRNLYRFSVRNKVSEALTIGEAHVIGTLGLSEDGSRVFFVAEAVLPETTGATAGNANLYQWHDGETAFIASLNLEGDLTDWTDFSTGIIGPAEGGKSSRVTPSGTTILFSSVEKLTGYNNNGHEELYLYETAKPGEYGSLICVSCNTNVTAASESPQLTANFLSFATAPRNAFLTRNLSSDGDRVFFDTRESLVPNKDTSNQVDVYEWEKEGKGSCANGSNSSTDGCVYLISAGSGSGASYFGDASSDGSDVFFFTRQSLVRQDRDDNVDLYDAKENGGIAAQNAEPASLCESEGCRESSGSPFTSTVPASTALSGAGDVVMEPKPTVTGKPKSKGHKGAVKKRRKTRGKRRKMARPVRGRKSGTKVYG